MIIKKKKYIPPTKPPRICKNCILQVVAGQYLYCNFHKELTKDIEKCNNHMSVGEFRKACFDLRKSKVKPRPRKPKLIEVLNSGQKNQENL